MMPLAAVNVSAGRFVLGVAYLALVVGSLAVAGTSFRRRLFPDWDGALARLVEVVVGLVLLVFILEALGTVGLFAPVPIVVAAVLSAVLAWKGNRPVDRAEAAAGHDPGRRRGSTNDVLASVAIAGVAAVVAEWSAATVQSYDVGILSLDSLSYHLPWAASYAQTGQITAFRFTDVDALGAFYPATGELFHALGLVLLGRDSISPGLNLFWLVLALLAAWCIGRPRGIGPACVLGATIVFATPMMRFSQAGTASTDIAGVFFLLAAVAVWCNAGERRAGFALAGLAAGIAIGIKLSLVAPVLALTVAAVATAPRTRPRVATAWLLSLVAAGSYWYIRNLVAVGNPLPLRSLGPLPAPPQRLLERTALPITHYLSDIPHLWHRYFEPGLVSDLGRWWYLVLAVAIIGPLPCLLRSTPRRIQALAVVALVSLAAYIVTPDSAAGPPGRPLGFALNLRYLAPALALALTAMPLATALSTPRRQVGLVGGLAILLAGTMARSSLWPGRHTTAVLIVGTAVLALGLATWAIRRRTSRASRRRSLSVARTAALAGLVSLVGCGAAAGFYAIQAHYLENRYVYRPHVSQLARTWAYFRQVRHSRVGIVGTYISYFSYPVDGLDASNRVTYIAHHGPHGAFTPIITCREWRAAVNAGHYHYLVTAPGRNPWNPKVLSPSPEDTWTSNDPNAHVLMSTGKPNVAVTVYRLRGKLDPSGCVGQST